MSSNSDNLDAIALDSGAAGQQNLDGGWRRGGMNGEASLQLNSYIQNMNMKYG
jgi:hypothetical protein